MPEQARRLLDVTTGDRLEARYVLAVTTGMRQGELLALRWRDLDLDAARLAVSQTVVSVDYRIEFSTPKTAHGCRSVGLDQETVPVPREHRKVQQEERLALGGYAENHAQHLQPRHPGCPSRGAEQVAALVFAG